ncbi:unnamed protein product [Ostreobium quekettii]|uniref:Uncharacterized protein n=1 Tax=Ostreobium quekettii TaxID=121088 RepID=A0A8S1IPM5_9CHLO|nr:unnamed protein product [Ostreobium quekettii]
MLRYCFARQVLKWYATLKEWLSGSWFCGVLPQSCPRGYVGFRLRQLQEGSSLMSDFVWDGSPKGIWPQQDLPTDSAIVFMLLSLYLKAPKFNLMFWEGNVDSEHKRRLQAIDRAPESGPLYIGETPRFLPPHGQFTGFLLGEVPVIRGNGRGVIMHKSLDGKPMFTTMIDGHLPLSLTGPDAVFEAIAVFLYWNDEHFSGYINGLSDEFYGFKEVLNYKREGVYGLTRVWGH